MQDWLEIPKENINKPIYYLYVIGYNNWLRFNHTKANPGLGFFLGLKALGYSFGISNNLGWLLYFFPGSIFIRFIKLILPFFIFYSTTSFVKSSLKSSFTSFTAFLYNFLVSRFSLCFFSLNNLFSTSSFYTSHFLR